MPRICGRQTLRDNVTADTPESYFKRTLTIPFLDHLSAEIETRFSDTAKKAAKGLNLTPTVMKLKTQCDAETAILKSIYKSDLPCPPTLGAEVKRWCHKWHTSASSELPQNLADTVRLCDKDEFPNLNSIISILCVVPVTSCEAERSFSALRRLKNYLRSTMAEDRLNGLAFMAVHTNVFPSRLKMSLTLLYIEALGDYCSVRVLSFVNFYRRLCIFSPLVRLSVHKYMI